MSTSGRITSHVLDLSRGKPVQGLKLELWRIEQMGQLSELLQTAITNDDGRLDTPLLSGEELKKGLYEIVFNAGDYYRELQLTTESEEMELLFDRIPIRFRVANEGSHYHIPLLVAPGGYSTYRGS